MQPVQGTLTPLPPFDFDKTLTFLGQFRPAMGEQDIEDRVLSKAISINGKVVVFRLRSIGTADAPELAYAFYTEDALDEATQAAVLDRIRFFLSLEDDLQPFYAVAETDPAFEPVMQELYGYHQVKFLTPFENAVWAILSQRNLMTVSRRMKDGLTERYGGSLEVEGVTYRAFPEPFQLIHYSMDELNEVIGNRPKAQGVLNVARAFDEADEVWLRTAPYEDAEKWLRSIKGIGEWSASFILLRGLGRMNHLPVGEKWLLEAARRWYGQPSMTHEDVGRLSKPYGEHAGYWAHYLRAAS